jgi:hypothetical protein
MGGTCGTCRGEVYSGFWLGKLRERDNLDDPDVDGRIILILIFKNWNGGGMDWIDMAQNRDRWAGCFKNRNQRSTSLKYEEFLD